MTTIEETRAQIQQIDSEILALIKKRVDLAEKVLDAKRKENLSINDEEQNQVVINRAIDEATELNLDTAAIKEIYETLIQMSIDKQYELSGNGNLP
ncbi:chorismate mutase [Methanohalobium evestigatum Z-7303]|uniref:Chorismate mutase n=1 Tax=Methanohalobium evestigatum (strain ATCC BAA-1072 / DSM 3721 / NBRC 107634 / OCM 161 / Z-7303) TaxID=644295 RepID=D7EAW8_METEZ|nr:chorismate mutase [Methanohalobium evestigatum]ADI74485.1 chorismate mutase [Methanohalobium evestigatum Z-7303]